MATSGRGRRWNWRNHPRSSCRRCRWASRWSAFWPGPTAAPPLPSPWRHAIATVPQLAPYAEGIALGIVVAVISFLSLVVGELVPKNIALTNPETIASWVARPMMWLARDRGPLRRAAHRHDQLDPAPVRHQRPGRVAPHRRRNQGRDQPGRGKRRARGRRGIDRPARAAARRSASGRDHDAQARHRVDRRRTRPRRSCGSSSPRTATRSSSSAREGSTTCSASCVRQTFCRWPCAAGRSSCGPSPRTRCSCPIRCRPCNCWTAFAASHKHMALVMDEFGAVEGLVTITDMLEALVGHLPGDASEAARRLRHACRRVVARGWVGLDGGSGVPTRRSTRCRPRKRARITRSAAS